MKLNREIGLSYDQLRIAACTYVGLPLLIFLGGFLKWYFAIPSIAALLYVYYRAIAVHNVEAQHDHKTVIKPSTLICVFAFTLIWTFLGGMNGYWFQTSDWNCRNAIYFDLIEFEWPVIYEQTGGALSYYIGHWLPPAFLAKLVSLITGSFRWGRVFGRMFLWGWSSLGLAIVILLLFHYLKVSGRLRRFFAVLVFVGFSGLDVFGAIYTKRIYGLMSPPLMHLEWWHPQYQFTSITADVYWVFNQTIVPWIVILCFMMEEDARNYVFYGVACLLCGPFALIGIAVCMLIKAAYYCAARLLSGRRRGMWKNVFSLSNIVMALFVFPFAAAYILTNNAVKVQTSAVVGAVANTAGIAVASAEGAAAAAQTVESVMPQQGFFSMQSWNMDLFIFLLLEVGLYLALVFLDRKKDPVFYAIILISILAPHFQIGMSNDFCLRVSIPVVFILMLYVSDFLQKHFTLQPKAYKQIGSKRFIRQIIAYALVICFRIGLVTPIVEVYRGFYQVQDKGTIRLEDMSIGTFADKEVPINFGCDNPEETFFFKYLAKN